MSFGLSALLLPPTIRALRRVGAVDMPNRRSSHDVPTPRGGGTALVVGGVAAVALGADDTVSLHRLQSLAGVVVVLGVVGLVDDVKAGLGPFLRLAVTFVAAVVWVVAADFNSTAAIVVVSLVVTGFTHAFNFMDGVNGISGVNGAAIAAALWWFADDIGDPTAAAAAAGACGACLAFLPFNLVRPSVFLGDAGSYAIGGGLALLAGMLVERGASLAVVAPFLPYLADTSFTVTRRVLRRERFVEAHREHAYQLLTDLGWSHFRVAMTVGAVTTTCAIVGALGAHAGHGATAAALVVASAIALIYAVVPHILQRPTATASHRQ